MFSFEFRPADDQIIKTAPTADIGAALDELENEIELRYGREGIEHILLYSDYTTHLVSAVANPGKEFKEFDMSGPEQNYTIKLVIT